MQMNEELNNKVHRKSVHVLSNPKNPLSLQITIRNLWFHNSLMTVTRGT